MATRNIPILDWHALPDSSGNCVFEPLSANFGSNNTYAQMLARFINTGSVLIKLFGEFTIPQNYSSATTNPTIVGIWSTTATSGNIVWKVQTSDIPVGSSADPAGSTDAPAGVTSAAAGTARQTVSVTIGTLTKASYAAGDLVEFWVARDKSSGSDTLAADGFLFDLRFVYADT